MFGHIYANFLSIFWHVLAMYVNFLSVFWQVDPLPNHVTQVTPEKLAERVGKKYLPSPGQ
jgi:hypothetical protein